LELLESESVLKEPVKVIGNKPPDYSSFYWINDGTKYKAFIPTKNRKMYINVEEYDTKDILEFTDVELRDRLV